MNFQHYHSYVCKYKSVCFKTQSFVEEGTVGQRYFGKGKGAVDLIFFDI